MNDSIPLFQIFKLHLLSKFWKSFITNVKNHRQKKIQWLLGSTTTLGTQTLWLLFTGGLCSKVPWYKKNIENWTQNWLALLTGAVVVLKVPLCSKYLKLDPKMMVVVDRWSLFGGGRKLRDLTVFQYFYLESNI